MKYRALALFDVDGTLLLGKKLSDGETLHGLSFSEAFRKVYGIETSTNIINKHGMTDQQIIMGVLKKNGLSESEIKLKIKMCMNVMNIYFRKYFKNRHIVLIDGVNEFLDNLRKEKVLMGLVTGNLEPIARIKMKKAGLQKYFRLGGYGSDSIDRSEMIKVAIRRARKFGFADGSVFLIGDTPSDIAAGKKAGVKTIGVATGIYSVKELEKSKPEYVFSSLKNPEKIIRKILYKTA